MEDKCKEQFSYNEVKSEEFSAKKIVVIGGGDASIAFCKKFKKRIYTDLNLIDVKNYYLHKPFLPELLSGGVELDDIIEVYRDNFRDKLKLVIDTIEKVDVINKKVYLKDNESVDYDLLIIEKEFLNNKESEVYNFNNVQDVENIRSKILKNFELAENEREENKRMSLLTVAIVGGNKKGVELAVAMREYCNKVIKNRYKNIKKEDVRIVIIEKTNRLVSKFSEDVSEAVDKKLRKLDIELCYSKGMEEFGKGRVELKKGLPIWAELIINCIKNNTLIEWQDKLINEKNITGTLCLEDSQDIFIIGGYDNVLKNKKTGVTTANNINRMICKRDLIEVRLNNNTPLINLGRCLSVTQLMSFTVKGVFSLPYQIVYKWNTKIIGCKMKGIYLYFKSLIIRKPIKFLH